MADTYISNNYSMSRNRFAKAATWFYMRRYWYLYLGFMTMGLILAIISKDSFGRVIGMILFFYPMTVPFRYSNAISIKARNLLDRDMHYEVHPKELVLKSADGSVTKAQFASIRDYKVINDTLVMQFGRATYLILPMDVLDDVARADFLKRVAARGN